MGIRFHERNSFQAAQPRFRIPVLMIPDEAEWVDEQANKLSIHRYLDRSSSKRLVREMRSGSVDGKILEQIWDDLRLPNISRRERTRERFFNAFLVN